MSAKLYYLVVCCSFLLALHSGSHVLAQGTGQGSQQNPNQVQSQVADKAFHDQMQRLHESLRKANTKEERKNIQAQIRQLLDQERAAHPPKKSTPEDIAARKSKMDEQLKKDSVGWQRYQLMEQMRSARSQGSKQNPGQTQSQVADKTFHDQMQRLHESLRKANTNEERKNIQAQIRQLLEQERTAHPPKKLTPEEIAVRKSQMEERLMKDPLRWQRYQLMEQMRSAGSVEKRKFIAKQIKQLNEQERADAEAKLTPKQRAERQVRREKMARMRQEMKPLFESMSNAKTDAERKAIEEQIRAIESKHR